MRTDIFSAVPEVTFYQHENGTGFLLVSVDAKNPTFTKADSTFLSNILIHLRPRVYYIQSTLTQMQLERGILTLAGLFIDYKNASDRDPRHSTKGPGPSKCYPRLSTLDKKADSVIHTYIHTYIHVYSTSPRGFSVKYVTNNSKLR